MCHPRAWLPRESPGFRDSSPAKQTRRAGMTTRRAQTDPLPTIRPLNSAVASLCDLRPVRRASPWFHILCAAGAQEPLPYAATPISRSTTIRIGRALPRLLITRRRRSHAGAPWSRTIRSSSSSSRAASVHYTSRRRAIAPVSASAAAPSGG